MTEVSGEDLKEGMEVVIGESHGRTRPKTATTPPTRSFRRFARAAATEAQTIIVGCSHGTDPARRPSQDVSPGRSRRPGAAGRVAFDQPGRVGRADGRFGLRQNHLDEHSRLLGPPQFRRVLARRPGDEPTDAKPAGAGAHRKNRLRLPEFQPAAADLGDPERRHAAGLFAAPSRHRARPINWPKACWNAWA